MTAIRKEGDEPDHQGRPTPRVYVERIDITGNTSTRDKVIRREFRLNEGDAFNALKVKRSQDRIQSLGFFQEKLEIKQTEGSSPDRVILGANVEEKPTGQLSLVRRLFEPRAVRRTARGQPEQFHGQGPDARRLGQLVALFEVGRSRVRRSLFPGQADPARRQSVPARLPKLQLLGNNRNTTYSQVSTGGACGLASRSPNIGASAAVTRCRGTTVARQESFYTDPDGTGPLPATCDPLKAGRYLCDEIGTRLTSLVGFSTVYDDTDGIHPTRGQRLTWSEDFAGLGGDVRYIRSRIDATKYHSIGGGWVVLAPWRRRLHRAAAEIAGTGSDPIRLTDRFFDPGLRGFDIRGIGPRVSAYPYNDRRHSATSTSRRTSPTRLAAALIIWVGWSLSSR